MVCYHVIFLTNKVIFPGPKFLKSVGMFGPEASVHSFVNSFLEMFIFLPSVQNEIHFWYLEEDLGICCRTSLGRQAQLLLYFRLLVVSRIVEHLMWKNECP